MTRSRLYFIAKRQTPQNRYTPRPTVPSQRQRSDSLGFIIHFPMPRSFWILPPSFTNFVSALVGQLRICPYHSLVVSKNPARSRRRFSVYLPVLESCPAFVMH